jgi:hypothetical protein
MPYYGDLVFLNPRQEDPLPYLHLNLALTDGFYFFPRAERGTRE